MQNQTYVDDLCLAMHDAQEFINECMVKFGFKFKRVGNSEHDFGMDFARDKDGTGRHTLNLEYIDKMISTYERMFGWKPKQMYKTSGMWSFMAMG